MVLNSPLRLKPNVKRPLKSWPLTEQRTQPKRAAKIPGESKLKPKHELSFYKTHIR